MAHEFTRALRTDTLEGTLIPLPSMSYSLNFSKGAYTGDEKGNCYRGH